MASGGSRMMLEMKSDILMSRPPGVARKDWRAAIKESLQRVADFWWRRFLPRHFQPSAQSRYKYQPRGKAYMLRKSRKMGHQRPLEFTGRMKREALRTRRITGTSNQATLRFRARAANFGGRLKRSGRNYPDMRRELTTMADDELRLMREFAARHVASLLNQPRPLRPVTRNT